MLKLKYQNSFIDAEVELPEIPRPARASSLPPGRQVSEVDALKDEVNLQIYVEELSEKLKTETWDIQSLSPMSLVDTTLPPTSTREISLAAPLSFAAPNPFPGSVGHPEACRKPCIYLLAGPKATTAII